MLNFKANLLATGIGSIPFTEAEAGCRFVRENFPHIPFWPQLPRRTFLENMYVQYSRQLPGVTIAGERMFIDTKRVPDELEGFYQKFMEEKLDDFALDPGYAAGFYALLEAAPELTQLTAIKGQITGPISFGLQVTDEARRAIIYDDTLKDAAIKNLTRIAQWQEQKLKVLCPQTIMFIDEPYLSSFGSAFVNLTREQVIKPLNEVIEGLSGLSAIHCCGNTDWSLLFETKVDIISLDAYSFGNRLSLYLDQLKQFLDRGGIIAWGIVPTSEEHIAGENVDSLLSRLEFVWEELDKQGIPASTWREASLITPACGVGSLNEDIATWVFNTTAKLSERAREKYGMG